MYIAIDSYQQLSYSEDGESFEDFAARFIENDLPLTRQWVGDLKFAAIIPHKLSITREID